jgi:hypothetical protein
MFLISEPEEEHSFVFLEQSTERNICWKERRNKTGIEKTTTEEDEVGGKCISSSKVEKFIQNLGESPDETRKIERRRGRRLCNNETELAVWLSLSAD